MVIFLFFSQDASFIVQFLEQIIQECEEDQRISILYFIDSICKSSIKNPAADEYTSLFSKNLLRTIYSIPPKYESQVKKLLQVWKERKIFATDILNQIETNLNNHPLKQKSMRISQEPIIFNINIFKECPQTPPLRVADARLPDPFSLQQQLPPLRFPGEPNYLYYGTPLQPVDPSRLAYRPVYLPDPPANPPPVSSQIPTYKMQNTDPRLEKRKYH